MEILLDLNVLIIMRIYGLVSRIVEHIGIKKTLEKNGKKLIQEHLFHT